MRKGRPIYIAAGERTVHTLLPGEWLAPCHLAQSGLRTCDTGRGSGRKKKTPTVNHE
jgi:hypothetical protein